MEKSHSAEWCNKEEMQMQAVSPDTIQQTDGF